MKDNDILYQVQTFYMYKERGKEEKKKEEKRGLCVGFIIVYRFVFTGVY